MPLEQRTTAAWFTAHNPILSAGEVGTETDTKKVKVGDGVTRWRSLAYGTTGATPTVTGSRGANAALASLLTRLAEQGIIIDSTT